MNEGIQRRGTTQVVPLSVMNQDSEKIFHYKRWTFYKDKAGIITAYFNGRTKKESEFVIINTDISAINLLLSNKLNNFQFNCLMEIPLEFKFLLYTKNIPHDSWIYEATEKIE